MRALLAAPIRAAAAVAAIAALCLAAPAAAGFLLAPDVFDDPPPGDELRTQNALFGPRIGAELVAAALEKTLAMLAIAGAQAPAADRGAFERIAAALAQARIDWPAPGRQFASCRKDERQAYVIYRTKELRLCHDAVHNRPPVNYLVQLLVHEGAHLVDIRDECEATRLEVAAMRLSGEGIEFRNAYMERCGLD